jgi:8-oxo-dGTP pyrophosphatase MutT (NUDIX family)
MEKMFFFAQKAFITHAGKLLLIQKSLEDPNQPGKWEVPGGRMEFGEDVDVHIMREVAEEVGIPVAPGPPFFVWQWVNHREVNGAPVAMQVVAVARTCAPLGVEINTSRRVHEDYLDDVRWVPLAELEEYDFIDNMRPVIDAFLKLNPTSHDAGPG